MQNLFFSAYGQPLIICDSADFSSDSMARGAGLDGAADSKSGILSAWLRLDGGNGSALRILNSAGDSLIFLRRATDNLIGIGADNSTSTEILLLLSDTAYTAGATWLHILASWNLATAAAHLYINDVEDLAAGPTLTDDTIDYTVADWVSGTSMDGCLAEVYFAPGQFLDFSVVTNRRKFVSSYLKPVYLGTDGSLPTGTAPIVYFHLADAEAVADFATNRGTGGDFTITGTLATGSTSPSD